MMRVEVSADGLAEMERMLGALGDRGELLAAAAAGVERRWQAHLRERYVPRDRDGVRFWADVVSSMVSEVKESGAVVRVSGPGLRLRYEGGVVTPGKGTSSYTGRPTRALAIPSDAVPVRDGRRVAPGQAGPLAFIAARGGDVVGYLIAGEVTGTILRGSNRGKPRVRAKGPLLFTLKLRQAMRGDAGILPEGEELLGGVRW